MFSEYLGQSPELGEEELCVELLEVGQEAAVNT